MSLSVLYNLTEKIISHLQDLTSSISYSLSTKDVSNQRFSERRAPFTSASLQWTSQLLPFGFYGSQQLHLFGVGYIIQEVSYWLSVYIFYHQSHPFIYSIIVIHVWIFLSYSSSPLLFFFRTCYCLWNFFIWFHRYVSIQCLLFYFKEQDFTKKNICDCVGGDGVNHVFLLSEVQIYVLRLLIDFDLFCL